VDHLAVSVQAYDMAFLDAWRWLALERTLDPFERYADTMAGFSGGWVEAVEILRETLEVQKVTIVLADPSPAELLTLLVPECGQVDLVGVAPQPVLTDSAVAMVQRQKKQGVSYAPGQLDRIVAFHGRQPQAQRSYGFEGLMLADLRGRYVADLDALARMPGVTTLGQTISAMAAE
jgi:hypothetical protein